MTYRTWKEAIVAVLEESEDAVHYKDIAQVITDEGLYDTLGATPWQSVAATISMNLKSKGESSPFVSVGEGYFMLRSQAEKTESSPFPSPEADEPEETDEAIESSSFITSFGIFWQRELVSWKSSRLLGQQTRKSDQVDFGAQTGVYVLYDRRTPIYVGRATDSLVGRISDHLSNRLGGRWDRFSWFGTRPVHSDGTLTDSKFPEEPDAWISAMEALLIEAVEPPQNRKRGDNFAGVEYLQIKDPELVAAEDRAELAQRMANLLAGQRS